MISLLDAIPNPPWLDPHFDELNEELYDLYSPFLATGLLKGFNFSYLQFNIDITLQDINIEDTVASPPKYIIIQS